MFEKDKEKNIVMRITEDNKGNSIVEHYHKRRSIDTSFNIEDGTETMLRQLYAPSQKSKKKQEINKDAALIYLRQEQIKCDLYKEVLENFDKCKDLNDIYTFVSSLKKKYKELDNLLIN